ncbi:pentapeptide repeat-containing protein [Candidatus Poribacteria bacterium]|nr:pentapeptide repeat-containing protein [Candidatus Poribacteria bacterium]
MQLTDEQMRAVRDLLPGVMVEGAAKRLWGGIDETRGKTTEQVKYVGGHAATLLCELGESFANRNLSSTNLSGASLYRVRLDGVNFSSAILCSCIISPNYKPVGNSKRELYSRFLVLEIGARHNLTRL